MSQQKPLTSEEENLLKDFLKRDNEADRHAWIRENATHFHPPEDKRERVTLHSGGFGVGRYLAEVHCEVNKAVILEHTSGGRVFEAANLYTTLGPEQANRLFTTASSTHIEVARGSVRVFAVPAHPDSVCLKSEVPDLIHKKDVTNINEVSRRDLLKIWHSDETSEKLEARKQIRNEINQGVKLIDWDGERKKEDREGQQKKEGPQQEQSREDDKSQEDTYSQRVTVHNDEGEKRHLMITGIKRGESIKGLELSEEHSRKIDRLKPDETLKLSMKDIRESIAKEREKEETKQIQEQDREQCRRR